jgi:hypothetical protein
MGWRGPLFHSFRGRRYVVRFVPHFNDAGHCDHPSVADKEIIIKKEANDKLEELDTILHEAIHATFWDLDEAAVGEGAEAIARFLWRLGYRR